MQPGDYEHTDIINNSLFLHHTHIYCG